MRRTVQIAFLMMCCAAMTAMGQNSGASSAAATRAAAPAAVTTPEPAQAASGRTASGGTASGSNTGQAAAPNGTARSRGGTAGRTLTGVPRYQAGFRGSSATKAPIATGSVSVAGGKGDAATGIDPSAGGLAVPRLKNALGVASGTMIRVRLQQAVDSGHAHNGDTLDGVLAAPLGGVPAGAPVKLTVVATAAAGLMMSAGEISLQVVSVNGENMLSNVITAEGQEGKVLLPDDAPPRGTEASFSADQSIELPAA